MIFGMAKRNTLVVLRDDLLLGKTILNWLSSTLLISYNDTIHSILTFEKIKNRHAVYISTSKSVQHVYLSRFFKS